MKFIGYRAVKFGTNNYKAIKEILSNGLDIKEIPQIKITNNQLEKAYSGLGKFCRNPKELISN